ncbi:hypothetical protein [Capnocytophaga sp. oral taxon 878]|uniref:hypothetical protein n=1 Tax=Capnocytophaga sp. oral taxon 878 TaxID=1316596 RepID=UPI000D025C1C|nr:hypothetical protein [Capnocytophaga sp. oral taxon 878]AVM49037.1 hypothetical protein C4H12_00330 [Capnocytophaga sp. oral taxon 878]
MTLETIITHYRNRLVALPDAILIGEIPKGAENISPEVLQLIAPAHCAFLKLCNGGSFGDIILWSTEELPDNQYRVPSDQPSWCEIGQLLYEPLFLDKHTQHVIFPADSYDGIEKINVDFDTFVSEYIFGSKYKEKIIGYDNTEDDWSGFLNNSSIC